MSAAEDQGISDKEKGILEPTPEYTPGSQEYKDYVDGYLNADFPG